MATGRWARISTASATTTRSAACRRSSPTTASGSWNPAAILDYLDELAGPERALLPRSGAERRKALNLMAMSTGAAEKGVLQVYERVFRPEDKRHQPWVDRCRLQMSSSLAAVDRHLGDRGVSQWLVGQTHDAGGHHGGVRVHVPQRHAASRRRTR